MTDLAHRLRALRLDAALNELYYRRRAARLATVDLWIRIGSASTGLGAVASFVESWEPLGLPLWRMMLAASVVASTASALAGLPERVRRLQTTALEWTKLATEIATFDLDDPESRASMADLIRRRAELEALDSEPRNGRLVSRIMDEIEAQEGHPSTT